MCLSDEEQVLTGQELESIASISEDKVHIILVVLAFVVPDNFFIFLFMRQELTSAHHLSGFTLVELIVVITILVILGTIAFVNIGGYSSNARDSTRVSDLTNIAKGLDILYAKNNVVLPPENGTNL